MISFRSIERKDLTTLKEWRNSVNVRPYVREYRLLNDDDQERWFESYLASRRKSDFDQEIGILEKENKVLGVGGFTRIEWRNQRAELTFYNVDSEDILEPIKFLLCKGFNEFNFHKITWPIYSHDPNLKYYCELFKVEAILKEEYYWNGEFQDRIYLTLLKRNYIKLDKKENLCYEI